MKTKILFLLFRLFALLDHLVKWAVAKITDAAPPLRRGIGNANRKFHRAHTSKMRRLRPSAFFGLAGRTVSLAALWLILIGLLFGVAKVRADDSFNTTNVIAAGTSIISFPTNTPTLVTNSSGSNTVTFLTGKGISVRDYERVGLVFKALCTSSNASHIGVSLIRANTKGGAPPVVLTNNGAISWNDWETTPAIPSIVIPIPAGTNVFVNWTTNLDVPIVVPGDYLGAYQITNDFPTTTPGWASNAVGVSPFGLTRHIRPFSLNGGNW